MKKLSARYIILFFLITASLCSYIFLNSVQTSNEPALIGEKQETSIESEEEGAIVLPDVTLMKKAYELGKRFIRNY